ncbi:MAG: transitional endoplasmic reticulum ATPase, partial [Limisphaerales bacterium]
MASGTSDSNSSSDEVLCALREALKISPNNAPLRQHLAESLLRLGWPAEAEKEFRMALSLSPENQALKLGLARAFQRQAKISHAVALLDELTGQPKAPGEAFVLHARLLYTEGEVERSVRQYRRGVEI